MMKGPGAPLGAAELRRLAEERLREGKKAEAVHSGTKAEMQRLLHELQVHQIELEMQNEELQRTRAELEAVLRQYTDLYDFAQVGYFTLDRGGTIRHANLTGARLLGVGRGRLVNQHFGSFLSEESRAGFSAFLNRASDSREKETCEATLLKNGDEPLYLAIEARFSEDGLECHAVAVDVTARKMAELQLVYPSTHDALTGLYNRGYFEDTMARLELGRRFPVSIVVADVDGLKKTNDCAGHLAGDSLLKRVAEAMTAAFRADDIIARIGGDEFAVLLPNTDAAAAEDALRRLQHVLQEHNAASAGMPVRLSFGASTAVERAPLADALREADENMYREKRGHDVSEENPG